jgi:hypothetical protein
MVTNKTFGGCGLLVIEFNRSINKETASPRGDSADTKSQALNHERLFLVDADKWLM